VKYNYLKNANTIRNSDLCRYDSLVGYTTDFSINGDVYGWDIYNNVFLYGCWQGILFGTASDNECYIGRTNVFSPLAAEEYYHIKVMMKLTTNNPLRSATKGKVRWLLLGDEIWNSDKEHEFDLISDDKWHLYDINLGPSQRWQGDINQLRFYPMIDGSSGDKFAIKYIKVDAINKYTCGNNQCDYYSYYTHPCPGAGKRAFIEAGVSKDIYTTTSGVNDELYINIGGYGAELVKLGTNINITGRELSKIIANSLSKSSVGAYAYVDVEHTFYNKIKIYSGSVEQLPIVIEQGTAMEELGFFKNNVDVSTTFNGERAASGFDYAAARRLKYFELNSLINDGKTSSPYIHNPFQYNVEAGRRDFADSMTASNQVGTAGAIEYFEPYLNKGATIIELSHPINDSGRLNKIYVNGKVYKGTTAKVYILRPHKNGTFKVISEEVIPPEVGTSIYTVRHVTYRVDCNILVSKGDVLAFYNIDVSAPLSTFGGKPNATFYQMSGAPPLDTAFDPGEPYSYGVTGFCCYARSNRLQTNVVLDIDLGEKVNIETFGLVGGETTDYFEYNIASCLDVNWTVNLYNEKHTHVCSNYYMIVPEYFYHTSIAYGVSCLSDGIRTPDNGRIGDSYGLNADGLYTVGDVAYFFVNGDAEWQHNGANDYNRIPAERHEFGWPRTSASVRDYEFDPITFYITFPRGFTTNVHKSIMYFKESTNFKSFSLNTYLGDGKGLGNSIVPGYNFVPSYTEVVLDGIAYYRDTQYPDQLTTNFQAVLFNNPMPTILPIFDADGNCTNQSQVETAAHMNWNIIEHKFDDIECAGFCIHTTHHASTKMMEIELYSKFKTDPTLVDNASLIKSDYGEDWSSASFYDSQDNEIRAVIGDATKYFKLELESQSSFELQSIFCDVSAESKMKDCVDNILLEGSKLNSVGEINKVEIENVFDRPQDLHVGIPRDMSNYNALLYWSKLDSDESIKYPQVGAGGTINKNDDYSIRTAMGQVGINCNTYGLKNLIDGVNIYSKTDGVNWDHLGTFSHGDSIGFYNENSIKESSITIPIVSSTYWKIIPLQGESHVISVFPYYQDDYVEADRVYYSNTGGEDTVNQAQSRPSRGINLSTRILMNDITRIPVDVQWVNNTPAQSIDINNSYAKFNSTGLSEITADVELISDFTFDVHFYAVGISTATIDMNYYFYDAYNQLVCKVRLFSDASTSYKMMTIVSNNRDTFPSFEVTTFSRVTNSRLIIKRKNKNLVCLLDGTEIYNGYMTDSKIAKIKITNIGTLACKICGAPMLSNDSISGQRSVAFNLKCGDLIDTIKIRHINTFNTSFDIYVSNNNINYLKLGSATIGKHDTFYENSIAVDLKKAHNLSIVRNYGSLSNKYFITKDMRTYYSNSDVESPSKVIWNNPKPTLLLQFDAINFVDTSQNYYKISTVGTPTISGSTYKFPEGSLYLNGSSYLKVKYKSTDNTVEKLMLRTDDFTMHWWEKRAVGNKGIAISSVMSYSNNYGYSIIVSADIMYLASYYGGYGHYTFSMGAVTYDTWTHWALCRKEGKIYAFKNGILQNSGAFAISDFHQGTADEYFLVGYYYMWGDNSQNYFKGYLDEIIIIRGTALWTESFTVPSEKYTYLEDPEARWLRINLTCGDGVTRCIDKLGVYPDITTPYTRAGGYNCNWVDLGSKLTNYYITPINVALTATVSGSSYVTVSGSSYTVTNLSPANVNDGIKSIGSFDSCWGFLSSDEDPTLELTFDTIQNIERVVIYHGPGNDKAYYNIDYAVWTSSTASGEDFEKVLDIEDNLDLITSHYFSPVDAMRVRLKILNYAHGDDYIYNPDADVSLHLDGGFVSEFEVYTTSKGGEMSSEDHPIICINMKDFFSVTNYELISKSQFVKEGRLYYYKLWNEYGEFFSCSDSANNNPNKVSFATSAGNYLTFYSSAIKQLMSDSIEYIFSESTFLPVGSYTVTWESYGALKNNFIGLQFIGNKDIIELSASILGAGWVSQNSLLHISNEGYYIIKGVIHESTPYSWGVGIPVVKKRADKLKWIALTYDTATNYSYDNNTNHYGPHTVGNIRIYSDQKFDPVSYHWWWRSVLSTLSNDSLNVKESKRSLRVDYPTSSGIDLVEFLQGDNFDIDNNFSEMDLLSFWLYISDITAIDTTFGGIAFGSFKNNTPLGYYIKDFTNLNLVTGWNKIEIPFNNFDFTNPTKNNSTGRLDNNLNFMYRPFESIGLIYSGVGKSFYMCIDSFKIKRNYFEDTVHFGKGLCLTWNEFLEIPISNLTLNKGTVEFWFKPYCDSQGLDLYGNINSRTLFTLVNNNNDIVSLGIRSASWFEVGVGNAKTNYKIIYLHDSEKILPEFYISYKVPMHVALVWSNDGMNTDNGDTVRLYLNGVLVLASKDPWTIGDAKSVNLRLGGANTFLAYNNDAFGSAIFENLRVYDYCKTFFDIEKQSPIEDSAITPNSFVELSKDGINFYKVSDGQFPFIFEQVPAGEKVPIFIRTNKDSSFKSCSKKTANLEITWVTPV
jgi:hypothetical protein